MYVLSVKLQEKRRSVTKVNTFVMDAAHDAVWQQCSPAPTPFQFKTKFKTYIRYKRYLLLEPCVKLYCALALADYTIVAYLFLLTAPLSGCLLISLPYTRVLFSLILSRSVTLGVTLYTARTIYLLSVFHVTHRSAANQIDQ